MIDKLQKNRKLYASLLTVLSIIIIGPFLLTSNSEITLIILWVLLIMILIFSGVYFMNGVVYAAMTLTYFGILIFLIILGVLLNYIVKVPDYLDKSSVVTGLVVILGTVLIQVFHLPRKAGDYLISKLNPELLPKKRVSDHSNLNTLKPYYYLFGNRVENISSGQTYALENSSLLMRRFRIWICILLCISGFIILIGSVEIITIAEEYGEFYVYLGIFVGFSLLILGFILLLAGFTRMIIGAAISVIVFFILDKIVNFLNSIYSKSLGLFWGLVVMGLCLIVFLFYRMIRHFDIIMSRNLMIYEDEGITIAFDLWASRELPLNGFTHFTKITLDLPRGNKIKKIEKWTDKIRYFSSHRRILLGGYRIDPSTRFLNLYFYAETPEKLLKLEKYIRYFIAKPIKVTYESDFENKVFVNELTPDTNTLIEILNKSEFRDLELQHFAFDRSFIIEFYANFKDNESLIQFLIISKEMGYGSVRSDHELIAVIKKEMILELNQMNMFCQKIHQLAKLYDGAFTGWDFEGDTFE